MSKNRNLKALAVTTALPLLFVAGVSPDAPGALTLVQDAGAVVGAPLTPASAAGVARRTTRRVVVAESASTQQQQAATAQQQSATAQQQSATAQQQSATAASRRLQARGQGRCRVPELRRRLLSRSFPGQQPGLRGPVISVEAGARGVMQENPT